MKVLLNKSQSIEFIYCYVFLIYSFLANLMFQNKKGQLMWKFKDKETIVLLVLFKSIFNYKSEAENVASSLCLEILRRELADTQYFRLKL